ncbi:hypothetical protein TNCV_4828221 [Trichonephila clavipes]|uniref:Uncharacterized protein n=1 Tax=Trichonephila clavipes TaxID=2585209 RepID=A0A8X6VNN6_TRICX|nr:hypothetical protein TNCV_4828221 [Trichonephila clavipes]
MATPGSSFTPSPLGHEDNLEVRYHPRANTLQITTYQNIMFGEGGLGIIDERKSKVPHNRVLDESRSFFRVHTGYFSNIPKCIKAEFIASWACSQSSVVSSSQR